MAALFGLVYLLRQAGADLEADLWLVANSYKESLGDLRGMKAVVDRFRERVQDYLVLKGIGLGMVYHRALGVQRLRVRVNTTGGFMARLRQSIGCA